MRVDEDSADLGVSFLFRIVGIQCVCTEFVISESLKLGVVFMKKAPHLQISFGHFSLTGIFS